MESVKHCDIFGKAITVNYKGESAYKTLCGAIFSILIYLVVFVFAAVQVE